MSNNAREELKDTMQEIAENISKRLTDLKTQLNQLPASVEVTRCRLEICQTRFDSGIRIAEMMQKALGL